MKILSMSGFVPEQVCDTVRFVQYKADRNIAHYCGYAADFISQVMNDQDIDGAVFPKSCDSMRIVPGYLSDTIKFIHQLAIPPAGAPGAESFYANSIRRYKESVESHYGITIDNIAERASAVNKRNVKIKQLYENIAALSFSDYLESLHDMLKLPLCRQEIPTNIATSKGGKRIFCVGSFLSNIIIAKKIEDAGLAVVGDTLTESGRLASVPETDLLGNIYEGIAKSILTGRFSPTQNRFRSIIQSDIDEMKAKGAKGVLFITQKYCEPYDFLYSSYKNAMDDIGMPILKISISSTKDDRKTSLALEAFADMI